MNQRTQNGIAIGIGVALFGGAAALLIGSATKGFKSEFFDLSAVTDTSHATPSSNALQYNPPAHIIKNANYLAKHLVDPLFDRIPFITTSWYRTIPVNNSVGGQSNSKHLYGQAVDITGIGLSNGQIIADLISSGLPFTKAIDEGDHVHLTLIKGQDTERIVID